MVTGILVGLTVGYAITFYYLAIQTKTCSPINTVASPNWFHGFWDRFLACRQINELGDTLGGAFAPIAFLWLAGTVFIQSQELAAQRQELDETQDVMREQLEVARQQVEETKASTALFRKQTEILEREQLSRDQADANDQFDEMVENFLVFVGQEGSFSFSASEWEERPTPGLAGDHKTVRVFGGARTYTIFPSSRFGDLADLAQLVRENLIAATKSIKTRNLEIDQDTWDERLWIEIREQLDELQSMSGRLSSKHQILMGRYRLQPLLIEMNSLRTAAQFSKSG